MRKLKFNVEEIGEILTVKNANPTGARIGSMGSLYLNFFSIYFCFELVGCTFTLENHTVTSWGISICQFRV